MHISVQETNMYRRVSATLHTGQSLLSNLYLRTANLLTYEPSISNLHISLSIKLICDDDFKCYLKQLIFAVCSTVLTEYSITRGHFCTFCVPTLSRLRASASDGLFTNNSIANKIESSAYEKCVRESWRPFCEIAVRDREQL